MLQSRLALLTKIGVVSGAAFLALVQVGHAANVNAPGALTDMRPLDDTVLSELRGGYQLAPGVSAYFSFSQISSINGNIVQTIVVPQVNISGISSSVNALVTGSDGTTIDTGGGATLLPTGVNNVPLQLQGSKLAVVTTTRGGQSLVSTVLAGSGITNQITNTANGAKASVTTSIGISTQGLLAIMQAQRMAASLVTNLQQVQPR